MIRLNRAKIELRKVARIYRRLYGGGGGGGSLSPLTYKRRKNRNIKMFFLIGSLHKEDFDFMEECLASAVQVSEVAWVKFSLQMFL